MREDLSQFDLIIGDTLNGVGCEMEENSADSMVKVIDPLRTAAGSNTSVLVIHHTRKSGGNPISAIRGSGAIAGAVDLVVGFGVSNDNVRTVETVGRFDPVKFDVSWTPEGGYVSEQSEVDPVRFIAEALAEGIDLKVEDILALDWPGKKPSRSSVFRILKDGPFESVGGFWRYSP